MTPKKVWVTASRICILNQNHAQRIRDYFIANQWATTDQLLDADLVVHSGCAVSKYMEQQSMNEILYIKDKINKAGKEIPVVVTGCLPDITKKTRGEIWGKCFDEVHSGLSCDHKDMSLLDKTIGAKIPFDAIPYPNDHSRKCLRRSWYVLMDSTGDRPSRRRLKRFLVLAFLFSLPERWLWSTGGKTPLIFMRYGYKVLVPGRGCKNACSYCCIRFAIGKPKSVPLPEIVDQFKTLLASGEKKFLLYPDDLGSWGLDIGSHWTTLLKELVSIEGDFQIALHNLGATEFLKEEKLFDEIIRTNKINFIGAMLEHTNARILKRMNRPPLDIDAFISLWNRVGKTNIQLNTHFMVGFPGETEEEFQDLLTFMSRSQAKNFHLNIFAYSRREGTLAARKYRDEELPRSVVQERVKRLLSAYNKNFSQNRLLNLYHSMIENLWLKVELLIIDYLNSQNPPYKRRQATGGWSKMNPD